MSKFLNAEFNNMCINFWLYARAHKSIAPKPPSPFHNVMMRGVLGGEPMDYPINPMYSAFVMCLNSLPEERQIAFYAVYIGNAYRNGKKVPIKSLASEIGVSRKAIYEWADNAAREVWGSALLHVALSKSLNREVEEFLD